MRLGLHKPWPVFCSKLWICPPTKHIFTDTLQGFSNPWVIVQEHLQVSRAPCCREAGWGLFFGTPDPSLRPWWALHRVPSRTIPLNPPTAPRGHHVHLPEEDSHLPEVTYLERVEPGLEPRSVWAPSSGSSCRSCDPSLRDVSSAPLKVLAALSVPEQSLGSLKHLHACVSFPADCEVGRAGAAVLLACKGTRLRGTKEVAKVTPSQDQSWVWNLSVGFHPIPQSGQALRFCVPHD